MEKNRSVPGLFRNTWDKIKMTDVSLEESRCFLSVPWRVGRPAVLTAEEYIENIMEDQIMGCVHIYCGDGKGKTTAATGLAVRAAGRNRRVMIARFLKTDDSGEVISLSQMETHYSFAMYQRPSGFTAG